MSHFTVLVRFSDAFKNSHGGVQQAINEMLAPYQENNMEDCPKEFLEFNDVEKEYRKKYKEESQELVRMPDGKLISKYNDRFKKLKDGSKYSYDRIIPDDCELVNVPHNQHYATFEKFMEDYGDYEKDESTGKYGYWENPNAKWDWFQIGGRWQGCLHVKKGARSAKNGEPSLLMKDHKFEDDKVDAAQKCDIDFEGWKADTDKQLEEWWKKYQQLLKGTLKEDDNPFYGMHYDLCQMGLRETPAVNDKEIEAARKKSPKDRSKWPEAVWMTKEITKAELEINYRWRFEFNTYAACTEKEGWLEKGKMGWFGCSTDKSEDREKWGKSFFNRFFLNAPEDEWFAVVDCHI